MKIIFVTAVAGRTRGEIAELDDQSAEIVIAQGLAREHTDEPDDSDPAEQTPAAGERRTRRR